MGRYITCVGLDVHKETISVCLAEAGLRGALREVRELWIANTPAALRRLATKLAGCGSELRYHALYAMMPAMDGPSELPKPKRNSGRTGRRRLTAAEATLRGQHR